VKYVGMVFLVWLLAGCETPSHPSARTQEGKAVIQGYITDMLNGNHWEKYDQYFGAQVDFNGTRVGKADLERRVTAFRAAYPDFQVQIDEQIAEGDVVVTRMTCTGTHLGPDLGVPATGLKVTFSGIAIDRVQEGKIVQMRFLSDVWGRMLQIRPELKSSGSVRSH
jgi:steroid delta-isomerase-like uncharacterized protein